MDDQPPIIREHIRKRLAMSAKVRCAGLPFEGRIVDLSEAGCKVRSGMHHAFVGATVFIKPSGLELIHGRIIWVKGEQFGVEFDQRIYGPVVDHLVRTHALAA